MRRALPLLPLLAALLCAGPAWAGVEVTPPAGQIPNGLTLVEALSSAESLTQTCAGWGLTAPVGASSCAGSTITRTASGANLTITNGATISEGATGTYYRWDISTNLTAGTITPSFCGTTFTAISTTGALVTTYRLFCPYQAAALTAPVLTLVAATAGTVDVAATTMKAVTSVVSGDGMVFVSSFGADFKGGASRGFHLWQGADASYTTTGNPLGFMLHGYDDRANTWIWAGVDSAGSSVIASSGVITFRSIGAMSFLSDRSTAPYNFWVDADSPVQVGDGTFSWGHTPLFGLEGVAEFDSKVWMDGGAHITGAVTVSGTAPALTSCGTGPSIVSGSTDHAGKFTIPGDGTGCVLTFAADQGTDTACVLGGALENPTWTSSDTALTVTAGPGVYSYVCYGL